MHLLFALSMVFTYFSLLIMAILSTKYRHRSKFFAVATGIDETDYQFVLSYVDTNVDLYNCEKYLGKFSTNSKLQKCHKKFNIQD
jgi:hypothetical protein